MFTRWTFKQWL